MIRFATSSMFVSVAMLCSASAETAMTDARLDPGVVSAQVSLVQPAADADLVLLNGGYRSGFRVGMPALVSRDGVAVAELVMVSLRPHASAALITALAADHVIQAGDRVSPKLQSL